MSHPPESRRTKSSRSQQDDGFMYRLLHVCTLWQRHSKESVSGPKGMSRTDLRCLKSFARMLTVILQHVSMSDVNQEQTERDTQGVASRLEGNICQMAPGQMKIGLQLKSQSINQSINHCLSPKGKMVVQGTIDERKTECTD